MRKGWYPVLLTALLLSACGNDANQPTSTARGGDPKRGRGIYLSACVACHNSDPSKEGPIGPAIKGSPKELIEARVLRSSYPPGYTPKRNTHIMPAQPYLKDAIPDLAAFLNEADHKGVS